MIRFQRIVQALSLSAFLLLLGVAFFPVPGWAPVDAFLRLDPLVMLGTILADRSWITAMIPAAIILALTAVLGRFFCGYLCPMGTTLDITDRLVRIPSPAVASTRLRSASGEQSSTPDDSEQERLLPPTTHPPSGLRQIKYLALFFILGAAVLGVSAVFLAAPLSLITRFYSLLIHPAAALAGDSVLHFLRPLALHLDWTQLAYAEIHLPRFTTQWFLLIFFLAVFALVRWSPRFWCRYCCPSGALLALVGRRPLFRRHVSKACTGCGACQHRCPMAAIPANPLQTAHEECIVCQKCVRICPVRAVSFQPLVQPGTMPVRFSPNRRATLLAGLAGAGTATLTYTGLLEVRGEMLPGNITPEELIRPPGSLPERQFLARCIRCGLCMRSCPTNTLQPIWFQAGVIAMFSPQLTPRRGPCEPECTVCGQVCPTGAIRFLPHSEKIWAKVGTATIHRHRCLAWEWNKKCLVCDEVCPYDAIDLQRVTTHNQPVPFVDGNKCSGCGFCEYHCPARPGSAIVVNSTEALRISDGSYKELGQSMGLSLQLSPGEYPVYGPQNQHLWEPLPDDSVSRDNDNVRDNVPNGLPNGASGTDTPPPGFTP